MSKRKIVQTWRLRYLYVGTSNIQKDVDYYTKVLGAEKVWDISSFGTRVAALRLGEGPLLLFADHRPAPSCILIFQVDDLQRVSKELRQKGWKPEGERFEIPEGPCYRFNDPSGNPLALLEITRPKVLGSITEATE
jgi:predicted enzyme related to lactoylglutathione lyase